MSAQALCLSLSSQQIPNAQKLYLRDFDIPPVPAGKVLIRMLAAPVNYLDLLVLANKYPVKPQSHIGDASIPGYDGVGEVVSIDPEAKTNLQLSDLVIPKAHGFGTWRTHAIVDPSTLLKLPKCNPTVGAILKTSVAPAHFLLQDMRNLHPGDWVVQTAASGTIAQLVIQFARYRGVRTLNFARDRDDFESTAEHLRSLGADVVLRDSDIDSAREHLREKRVVLALDALYGKIGQQVAGLLSPGGSYVVYGFLSKDANMSVSEKNIFYNQTSFHAFRLSECMKARSDSQCEDLWAWILDLFDQGHLRVPALELVDWKAGETGLEGRLRQAVTKTGGEEVGTRKQIFVFHSPL